MGRKILVGIPPKNHIILAMDEVQGLENLGYSCDTIPYSRNQPKLNKLNKLLGVLSNAMGIIKRLYRANADILYLNSRFEPVATLRDFLTVLLIKLSYWKPLKIVIKTHGSSFDILTNESFLYDTVVIPFLTKYVDLWLFLSHQEKESIKNLNSALAEKVQVTANIVVKERSIASENFKTLYNIPNNKFNFFFAGRMVAAKGIFSIIRSIPNFKYKDQCTFVFTGDGEDYTAFKQEIKELQLEENVVLTGFIPDKECDHFYANMDALVFPTYFDEGFPMALFKSVANGLPIITTKTRAAIDHLTEPENCLWVDGTSPDSVRGALARIFEDENLRFKMSENNTALGTNFSIEMVTSQMSQQLGLLF